MAIKKRILCMLFATAFMVNGIAIASDENKSPEVKESQQQGRLTGTVTDEMGPVIGASVSVKGTTTGVITDIDGKYSLNNVPRNATIVVSYIGYKRQEIEYNGQIMLDIKLESDATMLQETVVTALGIKRTERALGYAVTELKAANLDANVVNPVAALQGKVAGLRVAGSDGGLFGSMKIQIRGVATLKDNNQPIYVVDGIVMDNDVVGNSADWDGNANDYGNDLKNLNPDDFETVTVLKGAAATALYGSRGLNGAIVITTKGGGKYTGFGVNISQSIGFNKAQYFPKLQYEYGPGDAAGWVEYGDSPYNTQSFYYNEKGERSIRGMYLPTGWGPRYDGQPIENRIPGEMVPYSAHKDNMKDLYHTGLVNNTNISVQGGNEKTSYYSSASYRYSESNIPNNSFSRLSYMLKASHQISDRIKMTGNVSFSQSRPKNAPINMGSVFLGGSSNSITTFDSVKFGKSHYKGDNHTGMASGAQGDKYAALPAKDLFWSLYENETIQKETNIRPQVTVDYKMFDWLTVTATGYMNRLNINREVKELGTGYMNEGGYYEIRQEEKRQEGLNLNFAFNRDLNQDFTLGGFFAGEYWNTASTYQKSNTDGGFITPGQFFLNNSRNTMKTEAYHHGTKRILSLLGAVNLGWKNQVYFEVTGRNDWSSALVYRDGTGSHSYFYPSVSGSWVISETLKDNLPSWVSFAKIRASWAQVGNDTDPYVINQTYSQPSRYPQEGGGYIYAVNSPDVAYPKALKPERKNAWEFGLDWRFFDGRIGIDFTYYKENTKDQIMKINLPQESGLSSQMVNAGNIENKGIELALNTTPVRTKDWQWDLNFNYTKNTNKIIELHENVQNYIPLIGDVQYGNFRMGTVATIGGNYGTIMSDAMPRRDDNGNLLISYMPSLRVGYYTTTGEVQAVGDITPDFLGGINTSLRFKNFRLGASLDASFGGMMASYHARYGLAYGWTESSLKYRDEANGGVSWTSAYDGITYHDGILPAGVFEQGTKLTPPNGGDAVDVSGMTYREAFEKGYVEPTHISMHNYINNMWGQAGVRGYGIVNDDWFSEVKYIALREITLGYTLPRNIASKLGAKGLDLALSARNLGYLYNSLPNRQNPENTRGTKSGEFRVRNWDPVMATYMLTITANF